MAWLALREFSCQDGEGKSCLVPVNATLDHPIWTVSGPNGSGKTVLGRLVTGLSPEITDDLAITGEMDFLWGETRPHNPRVFSYLPQAWSLSLIGSIVGTDLELSRRRLGVDPQEVIRWAAYVGLNVDEIEQRNPLTLSRGERQRLLLSVLAALAPRSAYLDEPDAFLDDQGREALVLTVEKLLKRGTHIMVSTHDRLLYEPLRPAELVLASSKLPEIGFQESASDTQGVSVACRAYLNEEVDAAGLSGAQAIPMGRKRINIKRLPISPGKLTLLRGNNGTGKTTALRWLHQILSERHETSRHLHHRHVLLLSDDPEEQLIYRSIQDELDILGLARLPSSIAHLGGPAVPVSTLSWGQKRLLSIALAAAASPCVLLLDEPMTGLDSHILQQISDIIANLLLRGSAVLATFSSSVSLLGMASYLCILERDEQGTSIIEE